MASVLISGIYPPMVKTYNESFLAVGTIESLKVYFSLSDYNKIEDIKEIHLALTDASNNLSLVNDNITNIIIKDFKIDKIDPASGKIIEEGTIHLDNGISDKYCYYCEIKSGEADLSRIVPEKLYKVQIRFSTSRFTGTEDKDKGKYLSTAENFFSEWSNITLLRGTYLPVLDIRAAAQTAINGDEITIQTDFLRLFGQINFKKYQDGTTVDAENVQDYLSKYRIRFSKDVVGINNNGILMYDSGEISPNYLYKTNSFLKELDILLDSGNTVYNLEITYETFMGFKSSRSFNIKYQNSETTSLKDLISNINYYPDLDIGCMTINFSYAPSPTERVDSDAMKDIDKINKTLYDKILYIYRTDSRTNFQKYERICQIKTLKGYSLNNFTFQDKTAESGVWYKYGIRLRTIDYTVTDGKAQGSSKWTNLMTKDNEDNELEPVYMMLDCEYLIGEDKILKLSLDSTISNYGYQVSENSIVTLGGQYPLIERNGNQYYRQFSVTGIIYSIDNTFRDETLVDSINELYVKPENRSMTIKNHFGYNLFASENELYNSTELELKDRQREKFNNSNERYRIAHRLPPRWRDFDYEKRFREKVLQFLYNDKAKLFKSAQEGNILVKLTNISLTPNDTVDRLFYTFTATATEVNEANIKNYHDYEIQYNRVKMIIDIYMDAARGVNNYEASNVSYITNNNTITGNDSGYKYNLLFYPHVELIKDAEADDDSAELFI